MLSVQERSRMNQELKRRDSMGTEGEGRHVIYHIGCAGGWCDMRRTGCRKVADDGRGI